MHPVSTGTDIILCRDIKECTLTNTVTDDDGNSVEQESTAFSCEEVQYRYRGEVTADEVSAKFDYWWDIASGKTQQEADDNEAKHCLVPDGICGPKSWTALSGASKYL